MVGIPKSFTSAISSVDNITKTADIGANLVGKYVVSPIANLGLAGLSFDIFEEQSIELSADVTDHYTEQNFAVQDNIANKPLVCTLRGFVAEQVAERAEPKGEFVELAKRLTTIVSYVPVVTQQARQVNNLLTGQKEDKKKLLDDSIGTGVDLFKAFKELNPPKTKQAKAYNFLKALYDAKQLVGVDTPFGFLKNMAIQNIVIRQGTNSFQSDLSVTLKQIRFATTKLVEFDSNQYQNRTNNQRAEVKNKGKVEGKKVDRSILSGFFN